MWHRYKPVWYEGKCSLIDLKSTWIALQFDPILTDVDTINALMWSERLDDVFAENLKRDPTIYQYFASKEGLLRYFPAHKYDAHCKH